MRNLGNRPDGVVGIDPGMDGGLACLSLEPGSITACPMLVVPKGKNKRVLDKESIVRWFEVLQQYCVIRCCFLEEVHAMPKQGVVSMFTFGRSTGILEGIIAGLRLKLDEPRPQTWKSVVLAGTTRDKEAAIQYCKTTYPTVNLVPKGKRVPHDGIADAVCIADYGRRVILAADKAGLQV